MFFLFVTVGVISPPRIGSFEFRGTTSENPEVTMSELRQYYPLAKGNSWTYILSAPGLEKPEKTTWHVDNTFKDAKGTTVFVVFPSPAKSDDDIMNLTVDSSGIFDRVGETYLLKSPLKKGDEWDYPKDKLYFRAMELHVPCSAGNLKFSDCILVEKRETEIHLRTVIAYARGVGPVTFEVTKFNEQNSKLPESPVSILTLVSYKLSRMAANVGDGDRRDVFRCGDARNVF
jgi:hypothetical protein